MPMRELPSQNCVFKQVRYININVHHGTSRFHCINMEKQIAWNETVLPREGLLAEGTSQHCGLWFLAFAPFFPWGKKSETIVMMPPKTTPRGWFMVFQKQGPGAQYLNQ